MGRAVLRYPSPETRRPVRVVLPADGGRWLSESPSAARWVNREWDSFESEVAMINPNPIRYFARRIGAEVVEDGYEPLPEGVNA